MSQFVIFFRCKEALSKCKAVVTRERELAAVMVEPEGWVEATAWAVPDTKTIPGCAKTFNSHESAEKFIKRWKGHPWYYVPNGEYEIIEVVPRMVRVQQGFEAAPTK